MTFDGLLKVLGDTGINIFNTHKKSSTKPPYICYSEYMQTYRKANNRIVDTVSHIQVDLYSALTDLTSRNIVKKALNDNEVPFEYRRFDEETVIHHIFDCEVFEDGTI